MRRLVIFVLIVVISTWLMAKETIRIVWPGTSETEVAFSKELKAAIEKEYPNVSVEMLYIGWKDLEPKLITMVMAGNVPDLVMQQDYLTLAKMNALEPLNEYLKKQPINTVSEDVFIESLLKFSTYEGKIYTLPVVGIAYGLLVRTDLLEEAGCFGLVLEKIPADLGAKVAEELKIPVIGIGAGPDVDGQVLVLHDMLGITQEFSPRFLRRYHNLNEEIGGAVKAYINDVRTRDFPNENEKY